MSKSQQSIFCNFLPSPFHSKYGMSYIHASYRSIEDIKSSNRNDLGWSLILYKYKV